jgi:hypothetical protein
MAGKKERELQAEWEAMQKKWASVSKFARKPVRIKTPQRIESKTTNPTVKSLVTPGGSTAMVEKRVYTGTAIVGIATMHKSNLVPIFNTQAAKEVSQMRRG